MVCLGLGFFCCLAFWDKSRSLCIIFGHINTIWSSLENCHTTCSDSSSLLLLEPKYVHQCYSILWDQEHSEKDWHQTFSSFSVWLVGGAQSGASSQVLRCDSLLCWQRHLSSTIGCESLHWLLCPTHPTIGDEYVSLPGHASASFSGKRAYPESCSDAPFLQIGA